MPSGCAAMAMPRVSGSTLTPLGRTRNSSLSIVRCRPTATHSMVALPLSCSILTAASSASLSIRAARRGIQGHQRGEPVRSDIPEARLRPMRDLWTALALVLVIEGALYALFPEGMKRAAARALAVPPQTLRLAGLAAACAGVVLVWLVRR